MTWDQQLIKACTETDGTPHPHTDHVLTGAKWQREQLRTDEAIERVAIATYEGETELPWDTASKWVQDDCRMWARRSIDVLLGDTP